MLPGTQKKRRPGDGAAIRKCGKQWEIEYGWQKGRLTNKRGVRLRSSTLDIAAFVLYNPPQQRHQVDHWKTTVARLTEWLHATIQQLPRRCLVIVGTDANCEFGKTSSGNGSYQYTADGIHVGSHNTAAENFTSAEWWRLLQMEGLTVVDSHFPTGPTYFGQEAGHRSYPDHFFAPRDTIDATLSCCSLMGAMRDLQVIPHADPKDDPSEAWQSLVRDVRGAALPLFQRGALPAPTTKYAQQRQELLERRRNLSRHCRSETDRLAIRACDRETKRTKHRLDAQHVKQLLRGATAAAERGHTTTVWKLAYQIGGRYHGVKNRRFNAIPHYLLTLDEWTTTLLAGAAEGGFSAVQVPEPEFPSEIALALREQNDPDGTWKELRGHPAATAHDDWTDTLRRLRHAARRRCAPPRSAPAELWCAILRAASIEGTFQLPKGIDKVGTKAMRLIHCYCPFGKAWYRGIFTRHRRPPLPHHSHGYSSHRSRQGAQLVSKLHARRLRRLRVNHLQLKKDMTNAFPSTSHDVLEEVVGQIIPDVQDHLFLKQRRAEAVMEARAGDARGFYVPRHGAGMGDGNACELLVRSCVRPLEDWNRELLINSRGSFHLAGGSAVPLMEAATLVSCPCSGQLVDLSLRDHAGDVSQTLPLPGNNPFRAAAVAEQSSDLLAAKLRAQGGFAQNASKELVLPVLGGPGGYTATRTVLSGLVSFPGQPKAQAAYLGGLEQLTGGAGAEVRVRIDATRSAWCKLGRFWKQHVSLRLKRMAFLGVLQSAAYAGLGTSLLAKRDYAKLDAVLLGFAKVALRGVARSRDADGVEQIRVPHAWQVHKRLRIADARTELLVRRLRYWQQLAKYPESSVQAVAALLGNFEALQEAPVFTESGWIDKNANPWALQMQKDILAFRLPPKGKLFLGQGHSIRGIFTQYRVAAFFASRDPAGLRK
ncbi:unnamed protein product, partial [Prorocentrum cordatum]